MKNLFVIIALFLPINLFSQTLVEGSLKSLKEAGKVTLNLDFSRAQIHGMSEEAFSKYEEDWEVDLPVIKGFFIAELSEQVKDYFLVDVYSKSNIIIHVIVASVSEKGNYVCNVDIMDNNGTRLACIENVAARGGRFGTKLNLIKDGARHTGTALGKFLKKKLRRTY